MKRVNLLKSIICAAIFSLTSIVASAQSLPEANTRFKGSESIDTVTVNSTMPYKIAPVATGLAGITFTYKWSIVNASSAIQSWPINTYNGSVPVGATVGAGYVTDNWVAIRMGATVGVDSIKVSTRPTYSGYTLCDNDTSYTLQLVAVPTLDWDSKATNQTANVDSVICYKNLTDAISASKLEIKGIKLTGYGPWILKYTVKLTDLDGTSNATTSAEQTITIGTNSSKAGVYSFDVPASLLVHANADKNGVKIVVDVTSFTDRFSRKCLIPADVAGTFAGGSTKHEYGVVVLPGTVTQPLMHVKNIQ
jgi:hypothetical protein